MFAQFFGGYLFNHKLVTAEQLTAAFDEKKNTRMRLGVLAINAGLMTAEQVERVNVTQQSVDKRFGDLSVELGYMTKEDVDTLLSEQPTDYLLLGQTLVNDGALSNAEFESAINNYKADNQLSDDDISRNQNEQLRNLISEFYHFDSAENAKVITDYVTLLFKNIIRFIGDDFTPLEACIVPEFDAVNMIEQHITGDYKSTCCIAGDNDEYLAMAERFTKEKFNEINDFVDAAMGEFLNVNDGLFIVNESNDNGTELTLSPQSTIKNGSVKFEKTAFCIPVAFSFGEIDFIIANE